MDRSISAYSKPFYGMIDAKCNYNRAYIVLLDDINKLMFVDKIGDDRFLIRLFITDIVIQISTTKQGSLHIDQYYKSISDITTYVKERISEDDILYEISAMIKESKSRVYITTRSLSCKEIWDIYDEL